MSITDERARQLAELDQTIRKKITAIDTKYSTFFVEPELDLPDSLNLVPLTFTPKSDVQIAGLAHEQALPSYLVKKDAENLSYSKALDANTASVTEATYANKSNLAKLLAAYNSDVATAHRRLADNGLQFSSIIYAAEKRLLAEYNNNVDKENADYAHKCAVLATAKQNLDARHTERITYLDNQLAAREAELATEIRQKQENERLAVTKYNAALEEREVKYQASCARAREYAREAEYERALEASKLYSELGETGFNNQMKAEKLACCRFYMNGLTKEEALAIAQGSSFYSNALGTHYQTLLQWINDNLS